MGTLKELYPEQLWYYFNELTKLPRPTGHMGPVSAYLKNFCSKHNLDYKNDKTGNFVIRKPAMPGYEDLKAVILQAHLDMVCQKEESVNIDFLTDPLLIKTGNDYVIAEGTSLGADNGIGVAAILAVLASNEIKHGAIEALFTVDEEVGMVGVSALDSSLLKGELLINTDFEEEGKICVGCAGGTDLDISFQYKDDLFIPEGDIAVEIVLSGLKGGHSGVDIHLGRANALKLMNRFLKEAIVNYGARLASFCGGNARNAIPRAAKAVVTIPADNGEPFWELVADFRDMFIEEYRGIEDSLSFEAAIVSLPEFLIPEAIQDDLINAVEAAHNGVLGMLNGFANTVETSSNLGIINTSSGLIKIKFLERSCSGSKRYAACSSIESLFSLAGAKVEYGTDYPEWTPSESDFKQIALKAYQALFNEESTAEVMHAGLECGILNQLLPDVQMIAIGPTILYPHSPGEKVSVSSVGRFWDFLIFLLAWIPEKNV